MGDGADLAFRAPAKARIEALRLGNGFFGNFVDGRGRGLLFAETIPVAEGIEFVATHGIHDVVIELTQMRIIFNVKSTGQQLIERLVELLPRLPQMARLKIQLTGVKRRLALRSNPIRAIRRCENKGRDEFVLCIERKCRHRFLPRRRSNLNRMDLDRCAGRIFAPQGARKYTRGN